MSFHVELRDVSVRVVDGVLTCTFYAEFPYFFDPVKISFTRETDLDSGLELDIKYIFSEMFLFLPMVIRFEGDNERDDEQFAELCLTLQKEINYELYMVHLQEAIIEEMRRDCYITT